MLDLEEQIRDKREREARARAEDAEYERRIEEVGGHGRGTHRGGAIAGAPESPA